MKRFSPSSRHSRALILAGVAALSCTAAAAAGSKRVEELIADIQAGPEVFHTGAARDYLARTSGIAAQPAMPQVVEQANKALEATVALGEMGSKASEAVDVLVQRFPRAVHVTTAYESFRAGDGSFDDWVMTKVMGEKNKFLFSAPFLTYESLSKCDRFLEVRHEVTRSGEQYNRAGRLMSAEVTVHVTFTFYAGACALSAIAGQPYGMDADAWRRWWQLSNVGGSAQPAATSASSGNSPRNPKNASELVIGGAYRFSLTTGDVFTGSVESKTDTSIIIETTTGNPYTFRTALIRRCEVISLPAKKESASDGGAKDPEILSFDELRKRSPIGKRLEVRIKSGQTFEGALASVDEENVKLDVDGSAIPIHKDVIVRIRTVVPKQEQKQRKAAPAKPKRTGPLDTVVVRNPKTDNYGKPLPSMVYAGTIVEDHGTKVVLERPDGVRVEVKRDEIERIAKHTNASDAAMEPIRRYAMPLSCPKDMVLVDLPPAPGLDRPFFKTCIDTYEYPNRQDAEPKRGVSFEEAKKLCESQGKRLCAAAEWQWACSGLEGRAYPYGERLEENTCNSDGARGALVSGSRPKCVSPFGLHDMTGNVYEWVVDDDGKPLMVGGPVSKCQARSPGFDGSAKPLAGLRCCKSN